MNEAEFDKEQEKMFNSLIKETDRDIANDINALLSYDSLVKRVEILELLVHEQNKRINKLLLDLNKF